MHSQSINIAFEHSAMKRSYARDVALKEQSTRKILGQTQTMSPPPSPLGAAARPSKKSVNWSENMSESHSFRRQDHAVFQNHPFVQKQTQNDLPDDDKDMGEDIDLDDAYADIFGGEIDEP